MKFPVLNGIIDRRILINYRVDPDVVKKHLPQEFEPLVVNGYASAGICLLRLKNIGFRFTPGFLRFTSENAAHRFLVTWKKDGKVQEGVYIPRRHTDSFLNVQVAGKLFSWPHYPATFEVKESERDYYLKMQGKDLETQILIDAQLQDSFPDNSMFENLEHVSTCFEKCAIGYSPSLRSDKKKAILLQTKRWKVKPLTVKELKSDYFENESLFPKGSIGFDNALLMKNIEHEWHEVE